MNGECETCGKRPDYCRCKQKRLVLLGNWRQLGRRPKIGRPLQERGIDMGNKNETVIIKPGSHRTCSMCGGNNYIWAVNLRTFQREIVDCPACGFKRPELPENSHRTGPKRRSSTYEHIND